MIDDSKDWEYEEPDIKREIRYFATLLIANNKTTVAFSLLLANKDSQKVASILAISDDIVKVGHNLVIKYQKVAATLEAAYKYIE